MGHFPFGIPQRIIMKKALAMPLLVSAGNA